MRGRLPSHLSAWDLVLTVAVGAFVILPAQAPLRDVDLYWHRIVGQTLMEQGWPRWPAGPDPIAYTDGGPWIPGAWASEVLYHLLVELGGYQAITWLRLVLVAGFGVGLAVVLRRGRPAWVAALVFSVTALPLFAYMQDRPQGFSFVLLVPVAWALHRSATTGWMPAWWAVAGYTWVWANLHGLWVLVPAAACLLALADLVAGRGLRRAADWALRALAAVAAAALTPIGPELLLVPIRVSQAAVINAEWAPATARSINAWPLIGLLLLLLVALSTGRVRLPPSVLVVVVGVLALAPLNTRNVAVSAVLLAPFVADALGRAFPSVPTRSTVPGWLAGATAAVLAVVAAVAYAGETAVPDEFPARIAAELADRGDTRALVDYNAAGFVREFAGEDLRVAVDGRTDRYGADTLLAFADMERARPGWEQTFGEYAPDVVVARATQPYVPLLVERGWTVTMTDGDFVLLEQQDRP